MEFLSPNDCLNRNYCPPLSQDNNRIALEFHRSRNIGIYSTLFKEFLAYRKYCTNLLSSWMWNVSYEKADEMRMCNAIGALTDTKRVICVSCNICMSDDNKWYWICKSNICRGKKTGFITYIRRFILNRFQNILS